MRKVLLSNVGPKHPWGRNVPGQNVPGAETSLGPKRPWGRNVPGRNVLGAETSTGAEMSRAEMSLGPK